MSSKQCRGEFIEMTGPNAMAGRACGWRGALFALGVALLSAGCQHKVQVRGNIADDEIVSEIQPGVHGREDVIELLGSPSTVSTFQDSTWYYVGQLTEQFAFLQPEVVERKVSPRGSHLAFLSVPNSEELIELCSFPASGPVRVQEDLVHLAFEVENLDQTIDSLNAKNVPITDGPTQTSSGSRFLFIDAPDGYEVELIERPPGKPIV